MPSRPLSNSTNVGRQPCDANRAELLCSPFDATFGQLMFYKRVIKVHILRHKDPTFHHFKQRIPSLPYRCVCGSRLPSYGYHGHSRPWFQYLQLRIPNSSLLNTPRISFQRHLATSGYLDGRASKFDHHLTLDQV